MCKIVPFAATVSVSVSILTMIAISFDRFFIIVYPHKQRLKLRECSLLLVAIWIVAFLMGSVKLYNYSIQYFNETETDVPPVKRCEIVNGEINHWDIYFLGLFQFILPLVLLIYVYFRIGYYIFVQRTSSVAKKHIKSKRRVTINSPIFAALKIAIFVILFSELFFLLSLKVIKMIFIVIVIFMMSWFPLHLFNVLNINIEGIEK
jgi:hypothetical protein